jgi:hypothetical protein
VSSNNGFDEQYTRLIINMSKLTYRSQYTG